MTIRLVTDTSANLPAEWITQFDVDVVDLHLLEEDGKIVGTSAATPKEMSSLFQRVLSEPECTGIVAAHLSAKLSRTYDSSVTAAKQFDNQVRVVDSQSAGMALGSAVLQAAHAARNGMGLSAVYDKTHRLARGATTMVSVGSLDSLRRGGRIGTAVALLGGALAMKPLLEIRSGQLSVAAKARTVTKSRQRMLGLLRDKFSDGDVLTVVHHCRDDERAAELVEQFRSETPRPDRVLSVEFNSILKWHLGSDSVAVTISELDDPEFPIPAMNPQA